MIILYTHLSIYMYGLQVSAALEKLNEFKSVSILDFRCVSVDFDFFLKVLWEKLHEPLFVENVYQNMCKLIFGAPSAHTVFICPSQGN